MVRCSHNAGDLHGVRSSCVRVAFEIGSGDNKVEWVRLAFFAGGPFVALEVDGAITGLVGRVFQN